MKTTLHDILKTERLIAAARPVPRTVWQSFLVPVDFTDRSREALRLAVSLAADPEDRITLLHVIEPDPWLARGNEVMMTLAKSRGELCDAAAARLHRWATQEAGPDIEVTTLVRFGPLEREIVRVVETHRCDALVLATQPRSWFRRLFHRGLAGRLQKKAPCTVITIRPPRTPMEAEAIKSPEPVQDFTLPVASSARLPVRTAYPFPEKAVHFRPGQNRLE